jgi:hypothetical protein
LPAKAGCRGHHLHPLLDQGTQSVVVHHMPAAILSVGIGRAIMVKAVGAIQVAVG